MSNSAAQRTAANLRAHLARQRITQTELAKAFGLSQSAASRRYTGEIPLDVDELTAAAALLRISVSELLTDPADAA